MADPATKRISGPFCALWKPQRTPTPERNPMNWEQIEGDWKQFKGKAQQKWAKLTDDDVELVNGKHTEMLGVLQSRYGHDKETSEREINEWLMSIKV
jgi:uncharacterized protein YjbJ (UPF0337 family)